MEIPVLHEYDHDDDNTNFGHKELFSMVTDETFDIGEKLPDELEFERKIKIRTGGNSILSQRFVNGLDTNKISQISSNYFLKIKLLTFNEPNKKNSINPTIVMSLFWKYNNLTEFTTLLHKYICGQILLILSYKYYNTHFNIQMYFDDLFLSELLEPNKIFTNELKNFSFSLINFLQFIENEILMQSELVGGGRLEQYNIPINEQYDDVNNIMNHVIPSFVKEMTKYNSLDTKNYLLMLYNVASSFRYEEGNITFDNSTSIFYSYKFNQPFVEIKGKKIYHIKNGYIGQLVRYISLIQEDYTLNGNIIKRNNMIMIRDGQVCAVPFKNGDIKFTLLIKDICSSKKIRLFPLYFYNDYAWIRHGRVRIFNYSNDYEININYSLLAGMMTFCNFTNDKSCIDEMAFRRTLGLPFLLDRNKNLLFGKLRKKLEQFDSYDYGIEEFCLSNIFEDKYFIANSITIPFDFYENTYYELFTNFEELTDVEKNTLSIKKYINFLRQNPHLIQMKQYIRNYIPLYNSFGSFLNTLSNYFHHIGPMRKEVFRNKYTDLFEKAKSLQGRQYVDKLVSTSFPTIFDILYLSNYNFLPYELKHTKKQHPLLIRLDTNELYDTSIFPSYFANDPNCEIYPVLRTYEDLHDVVDFKLNCHIDQYIYYHFIGLYLHQIKCNKCLFEKSILPIKDIINNFIFRTQIFTEYNQSETLYKINKKLFDNIETFNTIHFVPYYYLLNETVKYMEQYGIFSDPSELDKIIIDSVIYEKYIKKYIINYTLNADIKLKNLSVKSIIEAFDCIQEHLRYQYGGHYSKYLKYKLKYNNLKHNLNI
jgi:hypothetical protein